MSKPARLLLLCAVCLLLAACSGAVRWAEPGSSRPTTAPATPAAGSGGARPAWYIVKAGDTLYAIACQYGLSVDSLAAWNDLGNGNLIRVGQRLRLSPPAGKAGTGSSAGSGPVSGSGGASAPRSQSPTVPAAGTKDAPPRWQWPVSGALVGKFGDAPLTASGVQLGGRVGEPVRAAAGGVVVYAGNGLVGYGELLIVKHNASWLSAYGYNEVLLVREGDRVQAGQTIARMGEGPSAVTRERRALLHFEIRWNGAPVDPLTQLPPRR
ncbi:MAG: peptidoglycan DD-metalloendopeptidase family protein [Gammaproteobacteria bacterium]